MDTTIKDQITKPIFDFAAAWAAGSGLMMSECFTNDAYFVAFDGTRLKGGKAIGDWHQPSLDKYLKDTKLTINIDDIQMLAPDLALVSTSGGAHNKKGSVLSKRMGESHEINLVKKIADETWKLQALQVTRRRPINGALNAIVWQLFNFIWAVFVKKS